MKYRKQVFAAALIIGSSVAASAVSAQSVVFRRPLPFSVSSEKPDSCPPGHECVGVIEEEHPSAGDNIAFGWLLDCNATPKGQCIRVEFLDGGGESITSTDASNCSYQQSAAKNDAVGLLGFGPPGMPHDFTQICEDLGQGGELPDEIPDLADNQGIGWYLHCNAPNYATCEIVTQTETGFTFDAVAPSVCDAAIGQSEERNQLVEMIGDLRPGNYDFAAMCDGAAPPSPPPPIPGAEIDTDKIYNPGTDPSWSTIGFIWDVSPWEGVAQCGAQADLRRDVACLAISFDEGGGPEGPAVIGMAPMQGETLQEAFSSPYFGKQSTGAKLQKAQFEGPENLFYTPVDPYFCYQEIGAPPPNVYTGDKAGCSYTSEVSFSEWYHPFGGSPTCSADAQRDKILTCYDDSGAEVDPHYCLLSLSVGGRQDMTAMEPERGNFESCTYSWSIDSYSAGCKPEGQPESSESGPVHYRRQVAECVREDGMYVEDELCGEGADIEPFIVQGQCYITFDLRVHDGICPAYNPYNYTQAGPAALPNWRTVVFPGSMFSGGAKACADAGSTCCEQRWNDTLKRTETVGSDQPLSRMSDHFNVPPGGTGYRQDDGVGPNLHYGSWQGSEGVPGTEYWRYDNEHRVRTQGASGPVWSPTPPRSN